MPSRPTHTPPPPPRSAAHTKRVGLVAAVAVAVLFAGVLITLALTGGGPSSVRAPLTPDVSGVDVPDITEGLSSGGRGAFDVADRSDPTRVAARMRYARLELLESGRYRFIDPQAWVYRKDGRVIAIRADEGKAFIPDMRSPRPDAGTLSGAVVLEIFDPSDGRIPDPNTDTPTLTARTDSVAFDLTVGELSTPDRVDVQSGELEFAGVGLTALVNEVDQRLQLLRVREGIHLRYTPTREPAQVSTQAATPSPTPDPASGVEGRSEQTPTATTADARKPAERETPATDDPVAPETLYQAVFEDKVIIVNGPRTIHADQLRVWARVFGSELPAGAIGGLESARAPTRAAPARHAGVRGKFATLADAAALVALGVPPKTDGFAPPEELADEQSEPNADATPGLLASATGSPATAPGDEPVTLTWTGTLELRPLAEEPEQLADDHVYITLLPEAGERIEMHDASIDATGWAGRLEYAATRRQAELVWPGAWGGAVFNVPGRGSIEKPDEALARATADLSTGVVHFDGPGTLHAYRTGQTEPMIGEPQDMTWARQADFEFAVGPDGWIAPQLRLAMFSENVTGRARDAWLRASDLVLAEFEHEPDGDPELRRLFAEGHVDAGDGRGGTLLCDVLDVLAGPGTQGESFDPTFMRARGAVRGEQNGQALDCGLLETELARGENARIEVTHAYAAYQVRFERPDGVRARADEITVRPMQQRAVLRSDSDFGASAARDATRIAGAHLELDGIGRSVLVVGEGTFTHAGSDGSAVLDASWSGRMEYDDAAGRLACLGDVEATATAPHARDLVTASEIHVTLEPIETEDESPGPTTASADLDALGGMGRLDQQTGERRVRTFRALGERRYDEPGQPAKVEARRYDPSSEEAVVQRLLYLEGGEILGDQDAGTLDVPGPGRLLVVDRERTPSETPGDDQTKGTTLLRWQDSMTMHRPSGHGQMHGRVRLTHDRLADGELTDLECQHLDVTIREGGSSAAPSSLSGGLSGSISGGTGRLVAAQARESVFLRSGERELLADRLSYDARQGRAEAFADPGRFVTVFDMNSGTPVSAEGVIWDLVRDRVDVSRPQPAVTPR